MAPQAGYEDLRVVLARGIVEGSAPVSVAVSKQLTLSEDRPSRPI